MTNLQRIKWYAGDGAVKAFDILTKKTYGSQSVKREEIKKEIRAQQIIDKKPKRRLGVRQRVRLNHPDSDQQASTSSAPPPNQQSLTQKRPRTSSSAVAKDAPQHKKGKFDGDTSSEGIEGPQPRQTDKGKGKALESERDEDAEMTYNPPTSASNESDGKGEEVLVPDTDDDNVMMSTSSSPIRTGSMSPPP